MIDDTYEPRLLREPEERNIRLRAVWWIKFARRMHYDDFRGEVTGAVIDQTYDMKRGWAREIMDDLRRHKERLLIRPERKVLRFLRQAN